MTVEIVLKNDDEGMFGGASTDGINVQQTIAQYEEEVTRAIKASYPDAIIEHQYGPYGGPSLKIYDGEGIDYDIIQDIVGRVYNRGSFWVAAE